jgi:hypothetical protein
MSSISLIGSAILVFMIAALLYQHYTTEGFSNSSYKPSWNPRDMPVAGRQYDPSAKYDNVPAELNEAALSPDMSIPKSQPFSAPGAPVPRSAIAQLKDLYELESAIVYWLEAAGQRDRESPGSLTTEQQHQRIRLEGRLSGVRNQLEIGMVTDSWQNIGKEIKDLRRDNIIWKEYYPEYDAIYQYGKGADPEALLSHDDFNLFMVIFTSALGELNSSTYQTPVQKVRVQQLQSIRQDLKEMALEATPPITMKMAKKFLHAIMNPNTTLPTLFTMVPRPEPSLEECRTDIIIDLRGIGMGANMLDALSAPEGRRQMRSMKDAWQPDGYDEMPLHAIEPSTVKHRAKALCKQIKVAFPNGDDAEALGCGSSTDPETVIQTVCDRLRYSVPSVTPEQFGCPARKGQGGLRKA